MSITSDDSLFTGLDSQFVTKTEDPHSIACMIECINKTTLKVGEKILVSTIIHERMIRS